MERCLKAYKLFLGILETTGSDNRCSVVTFSDDAQVRFKHLSICDAKGKDIPFQGGGTKYALALRFVQSIAFELKAQSAPPEQQFLVPVLVFLMDGMLGDVEEAINRPELCCNISWG